MSGVYIKMEMPKSCYRCDFSDGLYCLVCNKTMDKMTWIRRRPEWCPLIPVPDHGRLIDADALPWEQQEMVDGEWMLKADLIDTMKTIIQADKERDNADH